MPKQPINYQNTVIYKFVCNDLEIKDTYIGHTTNFIKRKEAHKKCAIYETIQSKVGKLYQTIKNTGGWGNWTMLQVEEYPCNNKREAEVRERYWIEQLHATLNSMIPITTLQEKKEYMIQFREQNKEQIKKQRKQYNEKNKEKIKEYKKEYNEKNKEQIKERTNQYYEKNKETIQEQRKLREQKNKV